MKTLKTFMEFVQSCKNSTEAYLEVQRIFSSRTMRDLCKVDFEDASCYINKN